MPLIQTPSRLPHLGLKPAIAQHQGNPLGRAEHSGDRILFSGRRDPGERHWILPQRREGALFDSAATGDVEVLRDLIEYVKHGEFNINGRVDDGGLTPAHIAAGYGNLEWLKVAQKEGDVDLWVQNNGVYPIDIARQEREFAVADNNQALAQKYKEVVDYLEAQQVNGKAPTSKDKKKRGWWKQRGSSGESRRRFWSFSRG